MSDTNKYNFKSIHALQGDDKGTSLNIGEWQGNFYMTVFENGQKRANIILNQYFHEGLRRKLNEVPKASPGTKSVVVISKWDANANKAIPITYVSVGKTDENTYYLEIRDKESESNYVFPFKTPISLDFSEPMSKSDRSLFGLQVFIDFWSKFFSQARLMSKFNFEPVKRNGNNNNGKSSGGKSSSGSQDDGEFTF